MQKSQYVKRRTHPLLSFRDRQSTTRKDFGKIFFSALGDDESQLIACQPTAAPFEDAHQVGMREFRSLAPLGKLRYRLFRVRGQQLDGSFAAPVLGLKNRG